MRRTTCFFSLLLLLAAALATPKPAIGDDGTLIVLNKAEASVSLLDRASGEEIARVATGDGPHEVAVSPDGKTAVVANYGQRGAPGNSLTVIDLPAKAAVGTIDLGDYRRPHGIVYLKDGKRVVVTSEATKKLLVVDLERGEVARAVDTKADVSHMVVVSADERRAYVANLGSASITAIDLEQGEHMAVVPTGEGAEAIDLSPDGRHLWVGNRDANDLSIVDTETLDIVARIPCERFPIRAKFTPDGKRVLVSHAASGDVAIFDVGQRKEIQRLSMDLTALEESKDRLFGDRFGDSPVPVGILIPPDGKQAYVANTNADIVTVIDLDSLEITGRLRAGKEPDGLGWTSLDLSGE